MKEDGTPFDQKDFAACVKSVRPVATLIGNDTDLTKYQPGYNAENQRIPTPRYEAVSLIPPTRKHTFAPEVDPAGLIDDEAQFEALSGIDWKSSTFQVMETAGGAERDEPEASTQQALSFLRRLMVMPQNNASPFGLGESCNRVVQTLNFCRAIVHV